MCSGSGPSGHLGPPVDPCGSCVFLLSTWPGAEGHVQYTRRRPTLPSAQLTAFDGVGCSLQGDDPPAGLWNMHPENQPHPRVLPADVRLAFPQLDVRVPQLQDPRTVNAARRLRTPLRTDHVGEQARSPTKPPKSVNQHGSTASHRRGGGRGRGERIAIRRSGFQPGTDCPDGGQTLTKSLEKFPGGKYLPREPFHSSFSTLKSA